MATKSAQTTKVTAPVKAKTAATAKAPAKTTPSVTAPPPATKATPQAKATPAAPAKAQVTAKAPAKAKAPAAPATIFSLHAPAAHEVYVIGDFNNWRTDDLKAKKSKDGTWHLSVQLKPGVYNYLFLVDGQWWTDPANPNRLQNPFGTENSVITVD